VTSFILLYPVVIRCLQQCAEELSDAKATASARMLLAVSACVLNNVLRVTHTHNLSQLLQSVQIDLLGAMAYVNDVTAVLSRKREGTVDSFADIRKQSCTLASLSDTELVQPRLTGGIRQRNRANIPAASPEEYYRCTVFIQFMDYVLSDLQELSQTTTVDNHSCIRQLVCIRCSATGGGNVSAVHQ